MDNNQILVGVNDVDITRLEYNLVGVDLLLSIPDSEVRDILREAGLSLGGQFTIARNVRTVRDEMPSAQTTAQATLTVRAERMTREQALMDYVSKPNQSNLDTLLMFIDFNSFAIVPTKDGGIDLDATITAWDFNNKNFTMPHEWRNTSGELVRLVSLFDITRKIVRHNPLTGSPVLPHERMATLSDDELILVAFLVMTDSTMPRDEDGVVDGLKSEKPTPTWARRKNALIGANPNMVDAARRLVFKSSAPTPSSTPRPNSSQSEPLHTVGTPSPTGNEVWDRSYADNGWSIEFVASFFNFGELKDIAFDLGVDKDTIPCATKNEFLRELVLYFQRRGSKNTLYHALVRANPRILSARR